MCGIVGHIGCKASRRSREVILGGLARLEYRGYDSAGIALTGADGLYVRRAVGKLVNLVEEIDADSPADAVAGIGHTRWATHGRPTVANAHPTRAPTVVSRSCTTASSKTRTPCAPPLSPMVRPSPPRRTPRWSSTCVARAYDQATPASYTGAVAGLTGTDEEVARRLVVAMRAVTAQLHGTFTLLVVSTQSPNVIVAARRSSPLVIGLGEGENFLGSDVLASSSTPTAPSRSDRTRSSSSPRPT